MAQFPEVLQFRAPSGTATALERIAEAEGKRPAMIVREAVMARLSEIRREAVEGAGEAA